MKKTANNTVTTVIALVALAVLLIGGYWYLNQREKTKETEDLSEVQILLEKDLDNFYPSTPRAVVSLYARIMQCIYMENITETDLQGLVSMQQVLFDEQLLLINPFDAFYANALAEWNKFKESGMIFMGYQVGRSSSVETWKKDGLEYASLVASFSLRAEGEIGADYQEFLLRKNNQNQWKILGWKTIEPQEMEIE